MRGESCGVVFDSEAGEGVGAVCYGCSGWGYIDVVSLEGCIEEMEDGIKDLKEMMTLVFIIFSFLFL